MLANQNAVFENLNEKIKRGNQLVLYYWLV